MLSVLSNIREESNMAKNQVKRSESEWDEIIRACKSSGLSDHQWCLEHGVSVSTFYRRLKKFRNMQPESTFPDTVKPVKAEHHAIVPLTILEECQDHPEAGMPGAPSASIRIQGISIDLYPGAGSDMVRELLRMAAELC